MEISQIIFTDDIIYPDNLPSANDSVMARIYYNILEEALKLMSPGISVTSPEDMPQSVDFLTKYYGAVGMRPDIPSWGKTSENEPSPRQVAMIQDVFGNSLVIGFCLSSNLKNAMQKAGVMWLDIIPHPARFVKGPALGIAGNIPDLDLDPWLLTEDIIKKHASIAKSKVPFNLHRTPVAKNINTAVFICQSSDNKELWENGRHIEIENFQKEIFNLIKKHDKILAMRDNYNKPEKIDLFFTQLCPKTSLYEGSFYDVLKRPEVTAVYSINSYKSIIANYFGKSGKMLASPYYKFGLSCSHECHAPVINPLSDQVFWREILKKLGISLKASAWPVPKEAFPCFFELHGEEISIF